MDSLCAAISLVPGIHDNQEYRFPFHLEDVVGGINLFVKRS